MISDGTTVEVVAEGTRPMVTKTARGPAAARLEVEAAILAAARHPGVVALAEGSPEIDADGTVRLRTRFAGSRTLATMGPVAPARAAGLVAALATTVADLHQLGIRHGRLTADHVIIANDGRPVICGFAEASNGSADRHSPADDVAALGRLLHDLVAPATQELEMPSMRRLGRHRSAPHHHRGSLLTLADQATADDPQRRPTAHQLAAALRTAVPEAHLTDEPPPPDTADGRPPRAVALIVGACGALVIAALAGSALLGDDGASSEPDTALQAPASDETMATSTTTARRTADTALAGAAPTSANRPDADPVRPTADDPFRAAAGCAVAGHDAAATTADGAPCDADVDLSGGLLTVDGTQFHLGVETATVALGDFGCAGATHPAVADLTTGHVFVFDRWATATASVDAAAVDQIDAPRQLLAEPNSSGCHRLVVLDEWGLRHVIDTAQGTTP